MGDVVNLNRARKTRSRAVAKAQAQSNRVVHGTPKAERETARIERERLAKLLDQARRDEPE